MKKSSLATVAGEPFGLRMGMSASALGTELAPLGTPFLFQPLAVPRPHPAFEAYGVKIAPRCGLAWIKAVGRRIATDAAGSQLKSAFAVLEAELTAAYGACERRDGPADGHDRGAPRDWMQGLLGGGQVLAAQWSAYCGSSLSDGLAAVLLLAQASSAASGFVIVQYTFENNARADAEIASWRIRPR
jgi:hypothetical protein